MPRTEDVQIVIVLLRVSTAPMMIPLGNSKARVLGLPDFVSIFDSLKEVDELQRFWDYLDSNSDVIGMLSGLADRFASFRDSDALLVDGAVEPDLVALDPHWGSRWRYKDLRSFWERAPSRFPDGASTWIVQAANDGLQRLTAKGPPVIAWSGRVGGCVIQTLMAIDLDDVDEVNGPLLELAVHCIVDALVQRNHVLVGVKVFDCEHLVLQCEANKDALVNTEHEVSPEDVKRPLFRGWRRAAGSERRIVATVDVNLARLQQQLDRPSDASFEVECAIEVVRGLCELLRVDLDEPILTSLRKTCTRPPRFTVHRERRSVEVPDFGKADIPEPEHYKRARRDLAVLLKEQGVAAPARYELSQAKEVIDIGRNAMRDHIHERVMRLRRDHLVRMCIDQHDRLTAQYQREVRRAQLSLTHEVSYNRAGKLAEDLERFTSNARNYRYLLECCVSSESHGGTVASANEVVDLIAAIDWLLVLYGASDTLHNDIEVGGLELSDWYVPTIFFSVGRGERERLFAQEAASAKLGVDLTEEDEVDGATNEPGRLEELNQAFGVDLGFSLVQLSQALDVLTRWQSVGGSVHLQFEYMATPEVIADKLVENVAAATTEVAHRLIDFLTLNGSGIRQLIGKVDREFDVPVWEHLKRGQRYLIRPLVRVGDGLLAWGAATTSRSRAIWTGSIANGYLPAEFQWPNVVSAVRSVKAALEKQLEVRAAEICARFTPHTLRGIDFRRRFPKEDFDDVGDFDTLAYWPGQNRWLSVECKYNQPPFCLKDARRLRERIFGVGDDRGQFRKIERRRRFLQAHADRLRGLLQWPSGDSTAPPEFLEVYVGRDIYWWMRFPPYDVPTEFLRIDGLNAWLAARM